MAQDQAAAAGAMAPQVDVRAPPKGVKFGSLLPMGVKGKQVTRKLFPQNGSTFSSATNNVIRIPLNGPFFLNGGDSYLSFDVAVKNLSSSAAITAAKLDSSAHSLINRLRIEGPDGSEVERIEDYASLHCFYTDFQQGAEHTWTQHGMSYVADRNGFPQANGLAATPNAIATNACSSGDGAIDAINTSTALLPPVDGQQDELYFTSTLGIPFAYCGASGDSRQNMMAQASTAPVFDFAQGNASVKTGTGTSSETIAVSSTSGYLKICIKLLSGVLANKRYIPVSGLSQTDLVVVP